MKEIGRSNNDRGYLVEMTQEEHKEFLKLQEAISGKTTTDINCFALSGDGKIDSVFEGVFGAIRAFYLLRFQVNDMRHLLDTFEQAVYVKEQA